MPIHAHRPGAVPARGVIANEPAGVVARRVLSDLGFELGGERKGLQGRVAGRVRTFQASGC